MTNQLYVFISKVPGKRFTYEAALKSGNGEGQFTPIAYGYGVGPTTALDHLNLEKVNVDKRSITFVRSADDEIKTMVT